MKNFIINIVLLSLIILFPYQAFSDVIKLTAEEWCPYNCKPNSNNPGYLIELAQNIFSAAGHTVEYTILPWSRAVNDTRRGIHNGILAAVKAEAPDFIFPEEPQGSTLFCFFVLKQSNWQYQGIESLNLVTIGLDQDYDYGTTLTPYINRYKDSSQISYVSGEDAMDKNIKKLLHNRIDALFVEHNVFKQTTLQLNLNDLFKNAGCDYNNPSENFIYIAFSPKHTKSLEYVNILSNGMKTIRDSGQLNKILIKYGLSDWK